MKHHYQKCFYFWLGEREKFEIYVVVSVIFLITIINCLPTTLFKTIMNTKRLKSWWEKLISRFCFCITSEKICKSCFRVFISIHLNNYSQYLNIVFSADDFSGQYMRSLALVNHTGRVFWPPPTKFRSTCPVDVAFFPFDDQTCILKLGSWLHDGYSVRLTEMITYIP